MPTLFGVGIRCFGGKIYLQILPEKLLNLVIRNFAVFVVVEVGVDGAGDDEDFLVAIFHRRAVAVFAGHFGKGIFAEIAAVGFFAVDEEHGVFYFGRPSK